MGLLLVIDTWVHSLSRHTVYAWADKSCSPLSLLVVIASARVSA
eukprot:COSAG04_NODE_24272_length_324_cov_0.911111_2_plen_43_part_01